MICGQSGILCNYDAEDARDASPHRFVDGGEQQFRVSTQA
jgi:hypothetical protein